VLEFGRDDEPQNVLTAADVARSVPTVVQTVDVTELVQQFSKSAADAVIVTQPRGTTPVGVVTRTALAAVLLDWYGAQLRASSEERASPRA
jgi:hypothetical protein